MLIRGLVGLFYGRIINTIYKTIKATIMNYFLSRYAALKCYPNAIIRKIKSVHYLANAGQYVIFNDYTTYQQWRDLGYVK
jgi:hypothetical protein